MAIQSAGLGLLARSDHLPSPSLPAGPRLYRYTRRWTGNRWVHAESALTHFNEFPFRGRYRKFPTRFPRKLSRKPSRRAAPKRVSVTFCPGNFAASMTARTSGKLYFPRPYVPMHREKNIVKLIRPSGVILSLSCDLCCVTSVYTRAQLRYFQVLRDLVKI